MATKCYLLGCDLGKSLDYTSFAVIEMVYDPEIKDLRYHLVGLDRIKGVDYPVIVDLIEKAADSLEKKMHLYDSYPYGGPILCMDASGLGAPIRDYLKAHNSFNQKGRRIYPVVFTGGEAARYDMVTHNYNISKSLIIGNFLSLMQHRRFDYAPDLEALPLLMKEIESFKYHLTASGHTGFDAEQGAHDDLICAVCIPLIIGEWRYNNHQKMKVGPKPAGW
jgi:hypothetical protein